MSEIRRDVNRGSSGADYRAENPHAPDAERRLVGAAWAQFDRIKSNSRSFETADRSRRTTLSLPGYRVLGEIHRGGQGVVYQVLQESTRRKAAVKVLKGGPFADPVELARFDREIDVLSRLNHPNIVAIHDRGLSDGHAYYVMDYIAGSPLDAYVAGADLPIDDVLRLFAKICDAVNVAHLRGVIHRDLKPGNIRIDLEGEPRILDFGLAKLEQEVAGGSSAAGMTMTGQFVGSLPWASPEQVGAGSDLLDVRSDVYSLGVILYQLLTSQFPYPVSGRIDDVIRNITQASPERPSSIRRGLDHDLELIVLKCLAKEPELRYQSAGELARDLRHYLADEPVSATSPSAAYRLRKFVRRNRGWLAAAAAIAATLVIAAGVSLSFGLSETRQRRAADAARRRAETAEQDAKSRASDLEQVARFQEAQLAGIDAQRMGTQLRDELLKKARAAAESAHVAPAEVDARVGDLEKLLAGSDLTGVALVSLDSNFFQPALQAIKKEFASQPLVQARLLQTLASTMQAVGLLEAARAPQEEALAIRRSMLGDAQRDTLRSITDMGYLLWWLGKLPEAEGYAREAVEKSRRVLGDDDSETLDSIDKLGTILRDRGRLPEAEAYCREALERRRRVLGDLNSATLGSITNLSTLLKAQGKLDESEALDREALEKYRRLMGDDHPHTLIAINNLAVSLQNRGKFPEAELLQREALKRSRRVLGEDHPDTMVSMANLAMLLKSQGKLPEAEAISREVLTKRRQVLGDDHPNTLMAINNLANVLSTMGKLAEAEPYCREAVEKRRRALGDEHADTLMSIGNLSLLLHRQGKLVEAEELGREVLKKRRRVLGDDHPDTLLSINNMAMLLQEAGKLDDAETFCREALERRRRALGEEHPGTITSTLNLGILLKNRDKPAEAEPYCQEALEKCRRVLGDTHPNTLTAIGATGAVLLATGKPAAAVALVTPAEPAARKAFTGDNAIRLARILAVLGRARTAMGEFAAARANLDEAWAIEVKAIGVSQQNRAEILRGLVELYEAWNAAEPGQGHDATAAEWRGKLEPPRAATEPADSK